MNNVEDINEVIKFLATSPPAASIRGLSDDAVTLREALESLASVVVSLAGRIDELERTAQRES